MEGKSPCSWSLDCASQADGSLETRKSTNLQFQLISELLEQLRSLHEDYGTLHCDNRSLSNRFLFPHLECVEHLPVGRSSYRLLAWQWCAAMDINWLKDYSNWKALGECRPPSRLENFLTCQSLGKTCSLKHMMGFVTDLKHTGVKFSDILQRKKQKKE